MSTIMYTHRRNVLGRKVQSLRGELRDLERIDHCDEDGANYFEALVLTRDQRSALVEILAQVEKRHGLTLAGRMSEARFYLWTEAQWRVGTAMEKVGDRLFKTGTALYQGRNCAMSVDELCNDVYLDGYRDAFVARRPEVAPVVDEILSICRQLNSEQRADFLDELSAARSGT